jgi:hypothetical protein
LLKKKNKRKKKRGKKGKKHCLAESPTAGKGVKDPVLEAGR